MSFDPELMKKLIDTFRTELEEQTLVITQGLLDIEKSVNQQEKLTIINSMLRAAHNIKGTSRSLGINHVGDIAHGMESIFVSMKDGNLVISGQVADACLHAVDKMNAAMTAYVDNKPLNFEINALVSKLNSIAKNKDPLPTETEPAIKERTHEKVELAQTDSVRVSIKDIEKISCILEEMQSNKIAIEDSLSEINKQEANRVLRSLNEFSILFNSLHDEIRTLRLVPASHLLATLPRYMRDLSKDLHKIIELHIAGEEVKIDKFILEELNDPITHLLRNCVDHGIENSDVRVKNSKPESGNIYITFKEESGFIKITIADDGSGIDINKIKLTAIKKELYSENELSSMSDEAILNLIFLPGFSTRELITDVSGRGVGLDVVNVNLAKINGSITMSTETGAGTTFTMTVPVTLSSERGLMVNSAGQTFAIPISTIERALIVKRSDIKEIEGGYAILIDKTPIPLFSLASILEISSNKDIHQESLSIVILKNGSQRVALMVNDIYNDKEIVIKTFSKPFGKIPCVAGGTLLGNNQVVIVLDPYDILRKALHGSINSINLPDKKSSNVSVPNILVVDDSITTRTLEKNILESNNYKVTVAVNGKEAWDLLQETPFSLLITDVMMPIMDGFTLTDHVKKSEKLKSMPVIIVTSLGSDEEKKRGIEVGANAYIVKNEFESGSLLSIVEQLVE